MSHQDKSLPRLIFHNGERCQGVLSQLSTGDGEKLFFFLPVIKRMRLAVLYRARFTVNPDGPVSWLRWRHPALLKEAPVRGCSPPAVLLGGRGSRGEPQSSRQAPPERHKAAAAQDALGTRTPPAHLSVALLTASDKLSAAGKCILFGC